MKPAELPTVSVILVVRNEEARINAVMQGLLTQTYPSLLEIIVIDGRSEDRTKAIAESIAGERTTTPPLERVLDNSRRAIAPAFTLGLHASRGELIVRPNARPIPAPDYVSPRVRTLLEIW